MDPVAVGAMSGLISNLCSTAIIKLFSSAASAQKIPELVSGIDGHYYVGDDVHISIQQVSELEDFLQLSEVNSLASMYAMVHLGDNSRWNKSESMEGIKESFIRLAGDYCDSHDYLWKDAASGIWKIYTDRLDGALPSGSDLEKVVAREDFLSFNELVGGPEVVTEDKSVPVFIQELLKMTRDHNRVSNLRYVGDEIREATRDSYTDFYISHAQEDGRFRMSDLYVERTLRRANEDSLNVPSTFLVGDRSSVRRSVVIGDPGVGKSTLTHWILDFMADKEKSERVPLLLKCRDYASSQSPISILAAITESLEVELSVDVNQNSLRDLLITGRAFVIFDGVDEILEIQKRQEFVRRAETFVRKYPMAGYLATSRRVGYAKAHFSSKLFSLYELQEFTEGQVVEYSTNWFRVTGKKDLERESFLRELRDIPDIKKNPLMLSLLCTLYRMRGYIPHNRLSVYRECSELLFKRWDAMRQIDQPYEHRHYGQRLIEALAKFFYSYQSTQSGVQEKQLKRIIANFFKDTSGSDEMNAQEKTENFLNFCADRAWLLTKVGTDNRGGRVFSFTHRTFMEYFAAEALVRESRNAEEVMDVVMRAYESDPSSVLADVMVQCYEEKQDRGAQELIEKFLQVAGSNKPGHGKNKLSSDKYEIFALRIMNACPVNARYMDSAFVAVFNRWLSAPKFISYGSCTALFEVHVDPRNRVDFLLENERIEGGHEMNLAFCLGWSRYDQTSYAFLYRSEWEEVAKKSLLYISTLGFEYDQVLEDYLAKRGFIDAESIEDVMTLFTVDIFEEKQPGVCLLAIMPDLHYDERYFTFDRHGFHEAIQERLSNIGEVNRRWVNGVVKVMDYSHNSRIGGFSGKPQRSFDWCEDQKLAMLWFACTSFEISYPSVSSFMEHVSYGIGVELFSKSAASHFSRNGIEKIRLPDPGSEAGFEVYPPKFNELYADISGFPRWFTGWVDGMRITDIDHPLPDGVGMINVDEDILDYFDDDSLEDDDDAPIAFPRGEELLDKDPWMEGVENEDEIDYEEGKVVDFGFEENEF
ncbi:NACHT domain-containing protein [Nocardiopsis dassonvillei]|uniref:NACHT domain-containing protein n=1 Tax=Nocardiopsis dassonvillei TaxID=2014 RepID=UPI00362593DD